MSGIFCFSDISEAPALFGADSYCLHQWLESCVDFNSKIRGDFERFCRLYAERWNNRFLLRIEIDSPIQNHEDNFYVSFSEVLKRLTTGGTQDQYSDSAWWFRDLDLPICIARPWPIFDDASVSIQVFEDLQHVDDLISNVPSSEMDSEVAPIAELIRRLSAYSVEELDKIAVEVARLRDEKIQQEAEEKLNALAAQLIDDLEPGETVTAKRLTQFFAAKAKAGESKRNKSGKVIEKGEVLNDEEKRSLVELVRAFRETGGIVEYQGSVCVIDIRKTKTQKSSSFLYRSANNKRDHITSSKTPLPVRFKK